MFRTKILRHAVGATAILASSMLYAATVSAKAPHLIKPTPAAGSISQGKTLVSQFGCNRCHNADLAGRPGFSPSIHRTGALHDYTQIQFIKLMHTGITNDGTHVRRPMPIYANMPTSQAVSIFAYLRSLK